MSTKVYSKRKSKKTLLLALIAIGIVGVVYLYTYLIREDLKTQAISAVQQNALSISSEIAASIGYAECSIQLASQSTSQILNDSSEINVFDITKMVLDNSPFKYIQYIRKDGWSRIDAGGEMIDVRNREYYKEGIKGETGVWVNRNPLRTDEVVLDFYTPVYHQGELIGVLNGALAGETQMGPILETSFSGEQLLGFLCDSKGDIIASTEDVTEENRNIQVYLKEVLGASDEAFSMMESFKDDSDKTTFEFRDKSGKAIGCISGVKGVDWCVVQIVPGKSFGNIMMDTTRKSVFVIAIVVFLFFLYFTYITLEHKRNNQEQNVEKQAIIEVLGKEYSCIYLIDTESGMTTAFRMSDFIKQYYKKALEGGLPWTESIADYAKRFVVEEERERFLKHCSLSYLEYQLKGEGSFFSYEFTSDHYGELRAFRMIATVLPDGKKQRIVLGFVDITEERAKETATQKVLQDAYYSAQEANEAKSRFLFNMSHDIRTPMNAILGFASRLEKCRNDEIEFAKCIEKIKASGECLLNIINNVLDLARIESGKATLDEDDFCDVYFYLEQFVAMFSDELEKKKLQVSVSVDVSHRYLLLDLTKIEQIYLNILSNAVKYTPNGGSIKITAVELPCVDQERACIQVSVEDTGIGMSEDFLPYIFDEFARERNSTESRIIGTGLGLGITKRLVDLMNGTIQVDSKLGVGTKVTITLCHRIANEKEMDTEDSVLKHENEKISLAGKRVLVAEDNDLNAEIVIAILEDAGCEVYWVTDGILCIDMLERKDAGFFDVILMDIQMPNMDGYKATSIIRNMEDKKKARTKIIAMTANAFEEDKRNAIAAGMQAHIAKPIDVKMFLKTIYEVLNGK